MALLLQLTTAGLAAVTAPAGTAQTVIASLGLTDVPFIAAPTLTALPGEFKRLDILSGVAAAPNVAHITAYDTSADVWNATGFGLFLDDGTLFASFSAESTVLSKAGLAFALMAFDIAFNADLAAEISFGNADFVWPPATEQTRGIARVATQDEVDAGVDDAPFVTPRTLATRIAAMLAPISSAIGSITEALSTFALRSVSITGGGVASGGGNLSADRTITVAEASAAEITAGVADDRVVTPRRLGPITMKLAQNGYIRFFGFQMGWGRFSAGSNGSTAVDFAEAFPTACFSVVASGSSDTSSDAKDNWPAVQTSSITRTGFSVFNANDNSDNCAYIAVGY